VLVVDDEEANREWLQGVLEPAGFPSFSPKAQGGDRACSLERADLVLLTDDAEVTGSSGRGLA